jgi:hypothetical protein
MVAWPGPRRRPGFHLVACRTVTNDLQHMVSRLVHMPMHRTAQASIQRFSMSCSSKEFWVILRWFPSL